MKTLFKAAAIAALPLTSLAVMPVPAAAQSKLGIAVVDLSEAVNRTTAAAQPIKDVRFGARH